MHLHALQKVKCGVDAWSLKQSHFFLHKKFLFRQEKGRNDKVQSMFICNVNKEQ
jgi:hypothetical protein